MRRVAAALGAALALLPALPAAATPAGGPRPASESGASAEAPVVMTIESVNKPVALPNGTVTISGQITNAGKSVLKGAHAAVRKPWSGKPLTTRSELAGVASRTNPVGADGIELDSPQYALNELAPGQSQPYTLSVAVNDLGFSAEGVYELAVDTWGSTGDNQRDRALGIARTFLPYAPSPNEAQPSKVTTLWPLVHAPVLVAQTMSDNDQTVPVLRDDSLAAEFAPGGRLYELVETGSSLSGLTWVIDPDLLDTAFAMTKPYRVQKPGADKGDKNGKKNSKPKQAAKEENTVLRNGSAAASAWLNKLRAAVAKQGSQVVSLPYADPDLASIAHNAAELAGVDTALDKAAVAGRLTVEFRLSVDTRSDVAWPYQGYLDQQIAALAHRTGSGTVLVNGASLPEPDALKYTPTAVRPIGNGQTAVVADEEVSALFQTDLNTPQAQTLAVQRFLAETFVISRQEPQNPRGLLVMPPRELTANTAKVLATAVQAAEAGKWAEPVKLDVLTQGAADPKANTAVPPAVDYPAQARSSELPAVDLSKTIDIQHRLETLMRVLTLPQRVRGPFSAAMVRSMSTEWRTQAPAGSVYRTGVSDYLDELTNAVYVPHKNVITLAGDTGVLQVSVRNDLTQAVTNLKLVVTPTQANRLQIGPSEELVLPAAQSATLRFPAQAHNNGPVTVTAQLMTTGPNPELYGEPQTFQVEVTSVTNGVLYVFGGALLLLLLAALRFFRQRKRRVANDDEGDAPLDTPLAGAPADAQAEGRTDAPAESRAGTPEEGRTGAPAEDGAEEDGGAPADGLPERGGAAQTPRGSGADGRDRAASDEKVGP
ncbi:DUF6049 family protein [Kitasatospora sp. CM 4170]|uniref:DUF6049 family protein n=1 Tax=Kitasatospora aburaviensis TaxID=67265 RepID=A0ABW1FA76_9ACTN|nr:DUF6049 family protein [Kitasatospora sp. CM 4170]WNM46827.1 DUF6049 family protein [Kitasatospora sp. CM 4170]